ncbi:M56 family metallopeptidase [Butyrivibrio sp. LC3010]|uniref:M56 family metallopeptidase n=1 Tax=Butyrivibrio sp. LC3010 TaxID=1280680 RepID=UPI0004057A1E|nr:M56 family metallopeptidase [Butyrivibrio sp. LC3010]
MGTIFIKIIEMSISAVFLMLAVILIRFPLKRGPKWFMGVLWAIVALRLAIPFQIETKIGLMPDFNGVVERFFNAEGTGSAAVETRHTFVQYSDAGYGTEVNGRGGIDKALSEEKDYLPAEEITTTYTNESKLGTLIRRNGMLKTLCIIWLLGVFAVICYAVLSFVSIWKKTRASIMLAGGTDRDGICGSMKNSNGSVSAFISDEIDTPFILGIFRPVVYLPSGLDDETLKNVLAHEKAHIRRKDHLRKQFGFILLAIHWFNPLVWISYILFCKDIELSCDEMVISRMSLDEKKSYATSLLLCSTHQKLILAYPLAFGEVGVKTRVKQIFNYKKPSFWLIMMLVVISTVLSVCFMTNASESVVGGEGNSPVISGVDEAKESIIVDGKDNSKEELLTTENKGEKLASTEGREVIEDSSEYAKYVTTPQEQLLWRWDQSFSNRDVQGILSDSTKDVQTKLVNEGVLFKDEDGETFGWSSPWPFAYEVKGQAGSMSYCTNEEKTEGEIHYYATDSEPHLYVWIEKIKMGEAEDGTYKVVGEHLDMYDNIDSFKDLESAYFNNGSDNDAINYCKNGLGEYLNDHAKSDSNGIYSRYFDPVSSARFLLNLSDDESKVEIVRGEDNSEGTVVSIRFLKENKYMDILMIKPWGEDGIYVPQMKMPQDNYGERLYSLNNPKNDYPVDGEDARNLLYTEDTEAKIGNLPYSDDVEEQFEDIHKDNKR